MSVPKIRISNEYKEYDPSEFSEAANNLIEKINGINKNQFIPLSTSKEHMMALKELQDKKYVTSCNEYLICYSCRFIKKEK